MGRKKITGDEKTVRISHGLLEQIDQYLDSEDAKKMALDSKVDVINHAVREYLQNAASYLPRN